MVVNCNTVLYEFGSRLNQRGFTKLCTCSEKTECSAVRCTHTDTHTLIAGMQTKCSLHCEGFDCWDFDLEQSHDTTNDQFCIDPVRMYSQPNVAVVISVNLKYIQHLCIEPSISYLFSNIYIVYISTDACFMFDMVLLLWYFEPSIKTNLTCLILSLTLACSNTHRHTNPEGCFLKLGQQNPAKWTKINQNPKVGMWGHEDRATLIHYKDSTY